MSGALPLVPQKAETDSIASLSTICSTTTSYNASHCPNPAPKSKKLTCCSRRISNTYSSIYGSILGFADQIYGFVRSFQTNRPKFFIKGWGNVEDIDKNPDELCELVASEFVKCICKPYENESGDCITTSVNDNGEKLKSKSMPGGASIVNKTLKWHSKSTNNRANDGKPENINKSESTKSDTSTSNTSAEAQTANTIIHHGSFESPLASSLPEESKQAEFTLLEFGNTYTEKKCAEQNTTENIILLLFPATSEESARYRIRLAEKIVQYDRDRDRHDRDRQNGNQQNHSIFMSYST